MTLRVILSFYEEHPLKSIIPGTLLELIGIAGIAADVNGVRVGSFGSDRFQPGIECWAFCLNKGLYVSGGRVQDRALGIRFLSGSNSEGIITVRVIGHPKIGLDNITIGSGEGLSIGAIYPASISVRAAD